MNDENSTSEDEIDIFEHIISGGDPETQGIRTHFWLECTYKDKKWCGALAR